MRLTEIFADDQGETHFRVIEIDFEKRAFAPPSMPVQVSAAMPTTTALFMIAPPGWDKEFHATPRKQFCVMLKGNSQSWRPMAKPSRWVQATFYWSTMRPAKVT